MSWAKIAEQAAVDIQEQLLNVRRGAVAWRRGGLAIAFGNDGYAQDERTHRAVNWLRYNLPKWNAPVLGGGASDDEFTWALVVRTANVDWLNHLVWRSWGEANPLEPLAWRGAPAACPPVHWTGAHDAPGWDAGSEVRGQHAGGLIHPPAWTAGWAAGAAHADPAAFWAGF